MFKQDLCGFDEIKNHNFLNYRPGNFTNFHQFSLNNQTWENNTKILTKPSVRSRIVNLYFVT